MGEPRLVVIEVGVDDMPNPVVTKDDSITHVSIDWSAEMAPELVAKVRRELMPVRGEHPRFAYILDRLAESYRPDTVEVMAKVWYELGGYCGRCERTVTNGDPDHRVTPIVYGGRGVECKQRGDYK